MRCNASASSVPIGRKTSRSVCSGGASLLLRRPRISSGIVQSVCRGRITVLSSLSYDHPHYKLHHTEHPGKQDKRWPAVGDHEKRKLDGGKGQRKPQTGGEKGIQPPACKSASATYRHEPRQKTDRKQQQPDGTQRAARLEIARVQDRRHVHDRREADADHQRCRAYGSEYSSATQAAGAQHDGKEEQSQAREGRERVPQRCDGWQINTPPQVNQDSPYRQ